ncbi:MAG: SRPBCC family protein [Deltaproteobacteria bacterium]|nr:SRPBCC family protein [Deltaproteobacteria bacterium]
MSLDAAQEVSVEIAATPAQCLEVLLDFERYPAWSSAVSKARILERDDDGVGRIVEFAVDAKVKTIRYVLEYRYKRPGSLTWKSIEGDVESIEGYYKLRKLGAERTEATCRQEITLGFWLPGPLRRLAERTALVQSVNEFRDAVERQVATPPGKRPRKG